MPPDQPLSLLACLLVSLSTVSTAVAQEPQSPERPNVLLIISDDQAWSDFGFEGHETIQTPHLDQLATEGAFFSRGYVPSSLCRPSLATLATGLYPHQHGITGNDPPQGVNRERMLEHMRGLDPLPARLTRAGYRCLQTGKWWEGHYSEGGFTEGMTHGDTTRGGRHGDLGLDIGRKGLERVTDFMDECQESNTPFFAWYAPLLPHQPHNPPARILERYRIAGRSEHIARYQAMCEWFDETCGTLLDHLDERGLAENTMVLFVCDNGWITDPETGTFTPRSKRSPYEGGVRTPIILRWPGQVTAGAREELVSSIDVVPTVLAAAGLEVTEELPGTDLVAVAGGRRPVRPGVFGATYAHDVVDIQMPARGLQYRWTVQGNWKLVRPVDRGQPSELFDLSRDPREEHDVALQNPAVVTELRESLDRWWPALVPSRPNLLLVVTDDQRADALGCAGHPWLQTPTINRLAAEGMRFTNAFVTTSICAASRATILTGRYERTHGYTFGTPPISPRHATESYPGLLRAAGYRTGFCGKWGVEMDDDARKELFEWFRARSSSPYMIPLEDGGQRHLTDVTADDALEFLEATPAGKSFCLTVSFNAPHAEDDNPAQYTWPAELNGLYDDVEIPPPPLADPAFFEALPEFMKTSESRVRWGWRFDQERKRVDMTRGYARMITGVDRALGRIMEALERLELADDTIVVFTSDNGYFLGERGFAGKWYVYEPSIRVPLIVYDPRRLVQPQDGLLDQVALNVDLAPTLLDLAGVPAPEGYEGHSLVPLLDGESPDWRTDFLYEHHFAHPRIPRSEGVRGPRWTYVRYYAQEPVFEELYDRWTDPLQAQNLATDPQHAVVLERLRLRCDELCEGPR